MKADQKVDAPAGGGSKKLIIIIVALVLVLGAGGGGAAWYFMHDKGDAHEEEAPSKKKKKEKKAGPPEYLPVDPFTVNLQPGEDGAEQYLQLAFTLEVGSAEEKENLKVNMAKVRSRVLLLLSSKKAADINTPEGKMQLAKEIVEQTSEPLEPRGEKQDVVDVLFTAFIIQ
ncbi:MAG: flagellar basal body-associated protein FliL [Duganella sp.]